MAKHITNYFERDSKLYARVSYTDSQGKRRQLAERVYSKSEVPDAVRKLEDKAKRLSQSVADAPIDGRSTVDHYLDYWLSVVKPNLRERTYDDYENILRRYVRPTLGKRVVSSIEPTDVQRLIAAMQGKKLAPRTIRYMHAVVSMVLKYAVFPCRLLKYNPADAGAKYVKLPKQDRKERVWLTPETVQNFLKALETEPLGLMLEFALMTGMRPSEYMALQWKDFEPLENATVTVRRTVFRKRKGGGWSFQEPKTEKSRREITFPHYLVQKLIDHKRKQNEERLRLGPEWKDHNLVFPSDVGTPLAIWNIHQRHFKPILKKAGLPDMRLYDLRHSFATLMMEDTPLKVVSELLGHDRYSTTADIYQHVSKDAKRQATDKFERKVKQG